MRLNIPKGNGLDTGNGDGSSGNNSSDNSGGNAATNNTSTTNDPQANLTAYINDEEIPF